MKKGGHPARARNDEKKKRWRRKRKKKVKEEICTGVGSRFIEGQKDKERRGRDVRRLIRLTRLSSSRFSRPCFAYKKPGPRARKEKDIFQVRVKRFKRKRRVYFIREGERDLGSLKLEASVPKFFTF